MTRQEFVICATCGSPVRQGDYVYQIKLDDGSIVETHGGGCIPNGKIGAHRLPNPLDRLKQKVTIQFIVTKGESERKGALTDTKGVVTGDVFKPASPSPKTPLNYIVKEKQGETQ